MDKELIAELKKDVPNFKSQLEADYKKAVQVIEIQHSELGAKCYIRVPYNYFLDLLTDIPKKLKDGYVLDPSKSRSVGGTNFVVQYTLSKQMIKESIKVDKQAALLAFETKVEQAEKDWLDSQLSELIEQEEIEKLAAAKTEREAKKAKLYELYRSV